jgi:hypothetical protein
MKKLAKLIATLVIISLALFGIINFKQYLYRELGAKHIMNYVGREKLIFEEIISKESQVITRPHRANCFSKPSDRSERRPKLQC